MELVAFVTCAALVGLCVWTLPVGGAGSSVGMDVRWRSLAHAARHALRACGALALCSELLKRSSFRTVNDEVRQRAQRLGLEVSEEEGATLLAMGSVTICVFAGLFARSVGVAVATALLIVTWFPMHVARQHKAKARELSAQMPNVLRTLATAMGAGNTLMQAIDYVGLQSGGPAAEAFGRASLRLRCGMPATSVLERLATELDAPGSDLMACALSISQTTGCPLQDLFERSALLVEQQEEYQRTLRVKTAQVRLSVRIVCLLPLGMVLLLSLISPDFRQGIRTLPGSTCLALAALMDGAALLIIRRILGGVL